MPSCKRCGECCKWAGIEIDSPPVGVGIDKWMKLHGIKVEERKRLIPSNVEGSPYTVEERPIYVMMLPCRCKALIQAPGAYASCALVLKHKDDRPDNCKREPTHPSHHPNSCKFFEED